jgi:hypothetical protein
MGQRLRALTLLVVLMGAGVLLGSALSQWWEFGPPGPGAGQPAAIQGRLQVEVLNGGGNAGMAREATILLRDLGLDVVYYGNAENFSQEPSVVIDRVGRLPAAQAVADALGVERVVSEHDSTRFVDVTVRLGPEWSLDAEPSGHEVSPPAWWDPRRYIRKRPSIEGSSSTGR